MEPTADRRGRAEYQNGFVFDGNAAMEPPLIDGGPPTAVRIASWENQGRNRARRDRRDTESGEA
jgi:hypothetical protein